MIIPLPPAIADALARLERAGYEAWAVGGCVRDALRGTAPGDYDLTTAALPAETEAVFAGERVIETGIRHGTVTVLLAGQPVEITTFRIDGPYTDARRPDAVRFTRSLREDLARRDFTVNAMAYSPARGLADPFGGQSDLAAGLLRCVGDPDTRFSEDALRIMRAARFASALDFTLDPPTAAAALRHRDALRAVSPERISAELVKLLCGPGVRRVLLDHIDLLAPVLPELALQKDFDQHHPCHIYTALEHTAAAVEAIAPTPTLRLAALLHDIAKPACFTLDADGTGHFYGHPERGAEMADAILRRLRFDTATRERVTLLVRWHDRPIEPTAPAVRRALNRLGEEAFFQLIALKRADNFGQGEVLRCRQREYDALERIAKEILAENQCLSLRTLAVNGETLRRCGIAPGPEMGRLLQNALNAVLDDDIPNEKNAILGRLGLTEKETAPCASTDCKK